MSKIFFGKHDDNRGSHTKFFTMDSAYKAGFNNVHEIFMTTNNKYTLRGLHRQGGLVPQQKIIKPVNGHFNIRIVFPRKDVQPLPTIDRSFDEIKSTDKYVIEMYNNIGEEYEPIYVPEGALLGYVALENNSKMIYIGDNNFSGQDDEGYNAFDKEFNIDWGVDKDLITASDRDLEAPDYE